MLPLLKVFSLFIRVFVRPAIGRIKKIHMNNQNGQQERMRQFFLYLGNWYHKQEQKINRKFMRINTSEELFIKPLSEDVAIEKGVEFFYEMLIYGTLVVLPLYEMFVASVESKEKSTKMNNQLKSMEDGIQEIKRKLQEETAILEQQRLVQESLKQHLSTLQGIIGMKIVTQLNTPQFNDQQLTNQ